MDDNSESITPQPAAATDAQWRLEVLGQVADLVSSSLSYDAAVINSGTPSAWLSISKDGVEIGRVFANRGVPRKNRTKFTVIAGSDATKTDCFGASKIVWLLKHADGQLQDEARESLLPQHLAYLQPWSERGDRVRCDMDLRATIESLSDPERGELFELFRQVVNLDHQDAIEAWMTEHGLTDAGGKLTNLVFLFDGLIRLGVMPADLSHYRLLEWDEGTHDREGWEW